MAQYRFVVDGKEYVINTVSILNDLQYRSKFLIEGKCNLEPSHESNVMSLEEIKNGIPFRFMYTMSNIYESILKGDASESGYKEHLFDGFSVGMLKLENDYISSHWGEYNRVIDDKLYEQFIVKSGIPEDRILDRKNLIVFLRDVVKDELNGVAPKHNNEEMLQALIDNNIITLPYDEVVQQSATAPQQPVDTSANQQAQAATQSSTAQPTDPAAPINRGAANSTVINNGFINPVIPPVQNVGGNPVYQNAGDGEVEVDLSLEATPMNDEVLKRRILENDKREEAYRIDVMPADARICS